MSFGRTSILAAMSGVSLQDKPVWYVQAMQRGAFQGVGCHQDTEIPRFKAYHGGFCRLLGLLMYYKLAIDIMVCNQSFNAEQLNKGRL